MNRSLPFHQEALTYTWGQDDRPHRVGSPADYFATARVTTKGDEEHHDPGKEQYLFPARRTGDDKSEMIEASSQDKPISHALQVSGPHQPLILLIHRR